VEPGGLRVLFVEDDPDTLAVIAEALRGDFAVWVARTGEQALEVAEELGFDADVLVVDLNLGPGMRGDEFVAEYRRRAKRLARVLVLSGHAELRERARSIGAAAILAKPYGLDDLVATIRVVGRKPYPPREPAD
jgi:two-component system KDP operon response regulator KdpE